MALEHVSNAKEWQSKVLDSPMPVFVDFWAEWCGPCRMVGPVVEELAGEYDGKVNFVKVNVDEANDVIKSDDGCPECGKSNKPGSKFCEHCGNKI